jgi:predicted transcriptional regulator of viral defense system
MTSPRDLRFLDQLAGEGRTAFTTALVRQTFGLSPQATSNLLNRLLEVGLVDRVASGRYAIRPLGSLGTAAAWDDLGSAVAAMFSGHPHRVGYLTALDYHGLLVRPARAVDVASPYWPHKKNLGARPLRAIYEDERTVGLGTEPLGPSRVATVQRALLDIASKPRLTAGAYRLAEALAAAPRVPELGELAQAVGAVPGFRRIGSVASTLSLPVAGDLRPPPWKSLVELDRQTRTEQGWVDTTWGVAWPYPASELEAVVAA